MPRTNNVWCGLIMTVYYRARIFKLLRIPKSRFLVRINSVVELILGRGEGEPENILWDMADSIPYLVLLSS